MSIRMRDDDSHTGVASPGVLVSTESAALVLSVNRQERMTDVGRLIREARERAGLSQAYVARALGIHYTYISHIEAGRRDLSMRSLVRLCDVLGLEVVIR